MEESTSADIKTLEFNFNQALEASPVDCEALLKELDIAHEIKSYTADKLAGALQKKLTDEKDVDGLAKVLAKKASWNGDSPTFGIPIAQILRSVAPDRNYIKFVDASKFGICKTNESFRRLALLRSICPGATFFDKTWGLGEVVRVDTFNSRIYIDFPGKPAHAMAFDYAAETLKVVPESHLLAIAHRDPAAIEAMIKNKPAELVKTAIMSFGPSTVSRLQNLLNSYGIVSDAEWKNFWSRARGPLTKDPLVNVPPKRSDPITIRKSALVYDDEWFTELKKMRNIPELFETLMIYEGAAGKPEVSAYGREVLTDRMMFAINGAFLYPPPMFTRLVLMAQRLNIATPRDELVEVLLEDERFLMAGDKLAVGEAGEMVSFIVDARPEAVSCLLEHIPDMNYTLLKQTMDILRGHDEFLKPLQNCVGELLASPKAPAPLVVWTLRDSKWDNVIDDGMPASVNAEALKGGILKGWGLPSLYEILEHAIAICEDRGAAGELLRMQHYLKDLYAKDLMKAEGRIKEGTFTAAACWFGRAFALLNPLQQEALFMRLQSNASIGDPKVQRALVKCMIAINPALEGKKVSSQKQAAPVEQHFTSWNALRARMEEFRNLVEVEIPNNTKEIEFARGYGDLRENFEYQSAKDQQRILLARREEWGIALEKMQGASFDGITDFSVVAPGMEVTLTKADGSTLVYSILGEWDNDENLGVLSCLSRLAKILCGTKVGDKVTIPAVAGEEEVTIAAIAPLSAPVREWIGQPFERN